MSLDQEIGQRLHEEEQAHIKADELLAQRMYEQEKTSLNEEERELTSRATGWN